MSIAIRHNFFLAPLAPPSPRTPLIAALISSTRAIFGLPQPAAERTSAQRSAEERDTRSVFHRLAASDLVFRDVAHPLFGASIRI